MKDFDWILEEAPKEGLVVMVERLDDISVEDALRWCEFLKSEKINVLPILEVNDLGTFYITLSTLNPRAIILANPNVASLLYFSESLQGYYYNIRIDYYNGVERQILVLPRPRQIEEPLLKTALERFEEIL